MFSTAQMLLMVISVPIFIVVTWVAVILILIKTFRMGKEFSKLISSGQVPDDIKEKMRSSLSGYAPMKVNADEIIRNLGSFKMPENYSRSPSGDKVVFWMYPMMRWNNAFDFKNSFLKCFAYARIKNLNFFDYGLVSQYAAIKISDGLIESYFADNKMRLVFNDKAQGIFDFKTRQIMSDSGARIGAFDVPESTSLRSLSIAGIGVQFKARANISIAEKKIAAVTLQTSTFENIQVLRDSLFGNKNLDVNFFQELDISSFEQSILVIGFGVSFLALLENLRPDR